MKHGILGISKGVPNEEIRNLLKQNVIGTPGKSLVYQHMTVDEKLSHLQAPYFLSVHLGGKVVGTCCFVKRHTTTAGVRSLSYYIRYFSFRSSLRSSSEAITRLGKKSLLRDEINVLLEGGILEDGPGSHLFYAYVDPQNTRSGRIIASFGFEAVAKFKTVFFSRFMPRRSAQVTPLMPGDIPEVMERLSNFYKEYSLVTLDNIGYQDGYLVYHDRGRIVAGLQANDEHWRVHEIAGGKLLLHFVSALPLLNRLFHRDFRFLAIEGIFYETGYEHAIATLLESALALRGRHTAILCLDPDAEVYRAVHAMDRGFIRHLTSKKEMAVMAKGNGLDLSPVRRSPVYVSGFDNM